MNIRKMNLNDIQAVHDISTACFSESWTLEALKKEVNQMYFIAEQNQEIVGFVGLRQILDEGEIMNVAVKQSARQQGIGKALLNVLLEEAKKSGICHIYLEVRESNLAAKNLYEQFNFQCYDKRKAYYHEPIEDALLYVLDF